MATIKVYHDDQPESPREWDNMGTMVAFHGRYSLGDKDHGFDWTDYAGWDEMEAAIRAKHPGCIILPLYLYDHSGITMNTKGFDCKWDSGQVGFIFATVEKIRECFGIKRLTDKKRLEAHKSLVAEVEVYDQYLRGDVYYFVIEDGDERDSCGGFYGTDWMNNGMAEHVPEELHEQLRNAEVTFR